MLFEICGGRAVVSVVLMVSSVSRRWSTVSSGCWPAVEFPLRWLVTDLEKVITSALRGVVENWT
jgi:hypothetical protein